MISDLKNACVGITSRIVPGGNKHLYLELGSSQEVLEQIFQGRQSHLPLRLDCSRDLKTGDRGLLRSRSRAEVDQDHFQLQMRLAPHSCLKLPGAENPCLNIPKERWVAEPRSAK